MQSKQKYIYWEQQGIDQLCGVHTINSLLQGPYFNEIQMSEIGLQIDQREQQLMGGNQMSGGKSHNVAMDGNFSIQVLQECLKSMNFTVENVDSKLNRQDDLVKETGFIFNSQSHWFTVRKVHGQWYNLNSCSVYGPESIGDMYLSEFLRNTKIGGYSVFVVRGPYPQTEPNQFPHLMKYQRFLTLDVQKKYETYKRKFDNNSSNIGAYDATNMDKVIEESKTLADLVKNQEMPDISKITEEVNKTQQFQGKGVSLGSELSKDAVDYVNFQTIGSSNEDPELQFVLQQSLKASLQEKFQQKPSEGINIRFLYPCGFKAVWTFNENSFVEDLYDFAFYSIPEKEGAYKFYLQQTHPTVKYSNLKQTLVEADIDDQSSLHVNKM